MTKREYVKLIKQISKATHDPKYGQNFANLLSAMRGPDNEDFHMKEATTEVIRRKLRWKCGLMRDGAIVDVEGDVRRNYAMYPHFYAHIGHAITALKIFGFDK